MSTSLEEMHELPLHIRVGRARAGVIMLIISDFMSILALLAAGGYLSTLNVLNQYRLPETILLHFCLGCWQRCSAPERTHLLLVGTQGQAIGGLHSLIAADGRGTGVPILAWPDPGICCSLPCL